MSERRQVAKWGVATACALALITTWAGAQTPGNGPGPAVPVRIDVDTARLREAPDPGAAIVARLGRETTANVVQTQGDWRLVDLADGRQGWVHASLLATAGPGVPAGSPAPPKTGSPPGATTGAQPGKLAWETSAANQLSMSFRDIEIRDLLSALAVQQNISIAMAKEVSGKVSVHLNQVTMEQALEAIVNAGGFGILQRGEVYQVFKPKSESDPQANRLEMKVFRLRYVEIEKVQEILAGISGIRMLKIHEPTKSVIVEDTPENIRKVETLIRHWDVMPQQVMIEAKILEVTLTSDMSFGVNWQKLLGDLNIGSAGFSTAVLPTTAAVSPIPATGTGVFANMLTSVGSDKQFAMALDALQSKTRVNTLSTPKLLAIHGKPARVQVGGQQGYKVTTTNLGVATETIEFINTGTILEITPFIDDSQNVLLKVQPSINSATIEQGIPVVSSSSVATWLLAKDGQTALIGGLIQNSENKGSDGIPVLSDIPLLGYLFGRTTRGIGKNELIVLITPRIIGSPIAEMDDQAIAKTRAAEQEMERTAGRRLQQAPF